MHKSASLFWGLVFIILAGLLLINQLGILPGDIWGYFFPFLAIFAGIWFITNAIINSKGKSNGNDVSIPLENAKSSTISLDHGAGKLEIKSGENTGIVLQGSFESEVKYNTKYVGDELNIMIRSVPGFMNWFSHERLNWEIRINPNIPTKLHIKSGASSSSINLSNLKVTHLDVDTGASTSEITLPSAAGKSVVNINTGASTLLLHIPENVAGKILFKTGITSVNINTTRFPMIDRNRYQSKDFLTATNSVEITINAGVGTIKID